MILERVPTPVFRHLHRLTDEHGLVAQADGAVPRKADGYCVDDAALALVVVCREPRPAPTVSGLARRYLDAVLAAVQSDGRCHNRMSADGSWTDSPSVGDWWGRALWGLAVAATSAETATLQNRAMAGFRLAAAQRSPHLRAMAFAGLGAAEILRRFPDDRTATALLGDAVEQLWWDEPDTDWVWPEPRLRHSNAALAETMLLGGDMLSQHARFSRGLEMLAFLLDAQTRDGHLSVTPVGGRGPGETTDGYQRPIEVAGFAEACATAYRITHERRWLEGIALSWRWFLGENDAGTPMFDSLTGGGYDDLGPDGPHENQGAESTLAMLATAQLARRWCTKP